MKLRVILFIALFVFSGWSVYTRYFDLNSYDLVTRMPFRDLSMMQYNETLAGTRPFPYQWRVLAFWLVRAVESVTRLDPHIIDAAVKTVSLAASTALLYAFAATLVSGVGAVLAAVLYLFVTAAAFASEGYAIYFTNDYLAVLSWFAGALAIRQRAWALAALAAFAGAWAKETPLLIVLLVTFEAFRKRAPWWAVVMLAAAFAIPTGVLRTIYPAPLSQWAWWDTFRLNVPFATLDGTVLAKSLRDNLKVLLFLNVLWWLAWRVWRRTRDPYLTSLASTLACYVALAWMLVYIRELRHMLPFTFFVIPLAVAELETLMQHRLIVIAAFLVGSSTLHPTTLENAWRGPRLFAQAPAQSSGYLLPPKVIVDMLDAPPPPTAEPSPSRDVVALLDRASMPTIAELAQPFHRLAGVRINPRTNAPHRGTRYRNITLKVLADNSVRKVTLPASPVVTWIGFSADGRRFAFTNLRDTGVELWVGNTATGQATSITAPQLNAVFGGPCSWIGEGTSLLCAFVNTNRGAAPQPPAVPAGPNIQENRGTVAPVATAQDMLTSAYDEALFEYYATSQLAAVDATTGQRTPLGRPAIYTDFSPSPNGQYALVTRIKRPFSWIVAFQRFPTVGEIWDRSGNVVKLIVDSPLADNLPRNGVRTGPRSWRWNPLLPATVAYAEALDGGNPRTKAAHRDKVMTLAAPFAGDAAELTRTEFRFDSIAWTSAGAMWLNENDRRTRTVRTWVIDAPGAAPRKLFDRSSEDAYNNPGAPLRQARASGTDAIVQNGDHVFLAGAGSSPQGDRPFLDRINIRTGAKERLFQTEDRTYEPVIGLLNDDGSRFLTRFETRSNPPQVAMRGREANSRRMLTTYSDPAPPLQGVKSEMVTYTRPDGVQMRATIHTPPGWTPEKGRLPALLWAYPREFQDSKFASQVTGSPYRFTVPSWGTLHMLFLTQGYAIIDDPTMPIVGPGETANDTYVEQLVASAQAAVDQAVSMGIVDRERVVAGGHSYGAFMTANLLAHSDIFRAGIARSGAYNRTLTPFGFQNEERYFWQVPQLYARMSPFYHADRINEPILLIHGEADDNSGTYPIQSERLYRALAGHGATVRYVTLPHEAHGYTARESVLHTVAEMLNWANEWAKNAKPRTTSTQQQ